MSAKVKKLFTAPTQYRSLSVSPPLTAPRKMGDMKTTSQSKTFKPVHVFRAGKRTSANGEVIEFTQAMLDASIAAYDPAKHEAPFVKGHPATDDPAFGWAASFFAEGAAMVAVPRQVDPVFAEDVAAGRWKKRSIAFYPPDHSANPVRGVYYPKHIGFLGAVPPSVKGMPDPEFAEGEEGLLTFSDDIDVAEFADWGDMQNASILRSLRDWIIGKFGLDEADRAIPGYAVQTVEQEASKEVPAEVVPSPVFTEPQPKGDTMSVEDKARLAVLEEENMRLKADQAAFAEAEKKRAADVRHAEHAAFAEGLTKEGKLLPAHKDVAVATLDFMAGQEQVVAFGEGDAKKPLADAFRGLLQAMPKQVEFSEVGKGDAAAGAAEFTAAPGYSVDQEKMATHLKALNYAEQNKCDYVTAVKAVGQV